MSSPHMLVFEESVLAREVRAIKSLADRVFTNEADVGQYMKMIRTLESGSARSIGSEFNWELKEFEPIRTVPSRQYEPPGRLGRNHLVAAMHYGWRLSKHSSSTRQKTIFQLHNAKTVIRLYEIEDETDAVDLARPLGIWRFEIGVHDSPGAYFHTSVEGQQGWFPHCIPVPRLFGLPLTPVAALEYVIGELFQGSWAEADEASEAHAINDWRTIQRTRLEKYLGDLHREVSQMRSYTPMVLMKQWKPTEVPYF